MDATITNDATISTSNARPAYLNGVREAAEEAMRSNAGVGFAEVAPLGSSGIHVIIVGAGFAGLACAIECRRKGHTVIVLEKFKELKILGEHKCRNRSDSVLI